ncbi:MAG: DUF1648 domain-containing protein [bacterium]
MKTWHKIGFVISTLLTLASWAIALYYWDKLPSVIPTHFGFNGPANGWSNKSIFYVFMIPFIQSLMLACFGFLYWKPQFSDMPTTLWLMTMGETKRVHAFDLIRTMLVVIGLWVGVLLTYITYGMNISALDNSMGLNTWLLMTIIVLMIIWLIWWTAKVYKATKAAIGDNKTEK